VNQAKASGSVQAMTALPVSELAAIRKQLSQHHKSVNDGRPMLLDINARPSPFLSF